MMTGQMPYSGETPIAIVLQHIQAPVPDPREMNAEITGGAAKVVMKMMAKAPEDRYQSTEELVHDIDVVLGAAKDGERMIADGGAMAFDEAMTLMGGEVPAGESGKAETLMEVAAPTPHTIDAGALRARPKSRLPLILGVGGGVAAVAVAVILAIVLLAKKEPEPQPEPAPETKTEQPAPEVKKDTPEAPGEETPAPPAPKIDVTITMPPTGSYHMTNRVRVTGLCGMEATAVLVNGQDAALGTTGKFQADLDLKEGTNDIKVTATGDQEARGEAIVTVIVDTTRPEVSLKGLSRGETVRTNTSPFLLEGTLDEMNPRSLEVNRESVDLDGESFRAEVGLRRGLNSIVVEAEDRAGHKRAVRFEVIFDPDKPEIALDPIPPVVESAQARLVLAGRASEALASLALDGAPVETAGRSFSVPVELREGANTFTFRAKDLAGNEASASVTVEYRALMAGFAPSETKGVYVWAKDGAEMVRVTPAGIRIGADDGAADEKPAHAVDLAPFFMDRTEVTNAQYRKFLDALAAGGDPRAFSHPEEPEGKDRTPAFWDDPDLNGADQPVVGVDWFDAWAYAKWAGKSLPTEAQWEAAASASAAGRKPQFPWGDEDPGTRANFNDEIGLTTAVGTYREGASALGLVDLAGNVQEWCLDWYAPDFYARPEASGKDPVNETPSKYRVMRGGHFLSPAGKLKVTARSYFYPAGRYETVGFRCVKRAE
jgi:formylglycine-generating enzyme required for sulfatase activity